ncbi:carbohydrate ABC transporter permease [Microbacterium immunditiarum]|uniref:Multiple sugar transport system permease protein n=1 Tax=Microbacterium immunditiarum TaxID=337480 RepID=A0A7Y9GSI9_9MICO|nr:sugar ABC transporter permease [Microbacterium immunditiarum]NYE21596.1 multiple sugar transport system permease protein [Microbacterium immunditiarum]
MASRLTLARREAATGWLWVQSWMVGFLAFTAIPILAAFALSFTEWNGTGAPQWVGFANYAEMFTDDPLFWQSLKVTGLFTVIYVPVSLLIGFSLALLMNQKLRGVTVFRTIYYLPSVLSGVAVAVLWGFVFHREYGVLNWFLGLFGVPPIGWLQDQFWVIPSLVMITLWGVGGSIIIYLGGLQGIPTELYEVAKLDGASWWDTLRSVTIPMMSPVILFQLVMGTINSFQVFVQAYVLTKGGPNYGSYFFALHIYNSAFRDLRLGYASALSVFLFLIVVVITVVVFMTSKTWVFYAGAKDSR